MFLNKIKNIFCVPGTNFVPHAGKRGNICVGNNVSATMCPRLPGPLRRRTRGHIVADTLLRTQMFPRLPARATFAADTNFASGTQKTFLILFRNILCSQQMFLSLRSPRSITSHNVSATRLSRLPGHLGTFYTGEDKFLHGKTLQSSTLRLRGTRGTGRSFKRPSGQVKDLRKLSQLFDRHGSIFRTDSGV